MGIANVFQSIAPKLIGQFGNSANHYVYTGVTKDPDTLSEIKTYEPAVPIKVVTDDNNIKMARAVTGNDLLTAESKFISTTEVGTRDIIEYNSTRYVVTGIELVEASDVNIIYEINVREE